MESIAMAKLAKTPKTTKATIKDLKGFMLVWVSF
jgi:hypothetical protein